MKNATLSMLYMLTARLKGHVSYAGNIVPVYSVVPDTAVAPYIYLSTMTASQAPGGKKECEFQEATALIDIVTRVTDENESLIPVETIGSAVLARLFDEPLSANDFNIQSIRLESSSNLTELTSMGKNLRKLIRIRISLYQNTY